MFSETVEGLSNFSQIPSKYFEHDKELFINSEENISDLLKATNSRLSCDTQYPNLASWHDKVRLVSVWVGFLSPWAAA